MSTNVTLAMIVKNEAHIIERCLESVYKHVERAVIIDTGSTDDTISRIKAFGYANNFDIRLVERPWVDFAANRTELVATARAYCHSDGYLLLLDADHVFQGDLSGIRDGASYMVKITGEPTYYLPYLVRADIPWRYVSRTHEYITSDIPVPEGTKITSCWLDHYCDGGTRPEKFERDLKFLEEDYNDNPDDARATFYLAETYKNSGRADEAAGLYRHRLGLGGWVEELYMAALELGRITGSADDLLTAWNLLPDRAEAPHDLIKLLNERGNHIGAYAIAIAAQRLLNLGGYDGNGWLLFVDKWIEDYGFAFETAIALWWHGDTEEANGIFRFILSMDNIPQNYQEPCRSNLALTSG